MQKYECTVCGYIYDPAVGDPDNGFPRDRVRGPPRRLDLPRLRCREGLVRALHGLEATPDDLRRPIPDPA